MAEAEGIEKLLSMEVSGKFGLNCEFGCGMYALSVYGDEPVYIPRHNKDPMLMSGIFQRRHRGSKRITALLKYYQPPNMRTAPQLVRRGAFADAVAGWQGLTTNQKQVYNERASGKKMSGYNLYLKEYLLSH